MQATMQGKQATSHCLLRAVEQGSIPKGGCNFGDWLILLLRLCAANRPRGWLLGVYIDGRGGWFLWVTAGT